MPRKTTEQLILEVHSRLTNEQVNKKKEELLIKYAENGLSNNAMMEIIAKEIGVDMEEKNKLGGMKEMENMKEIKGTIDDKNMKEGAKDGKVWKRYTYKINGMTLSSFNEFPFTIGQNVVAKYKESTSGTNIYHNIMGMELDTGMVVKEETIGMDNAIKAVKEEEKRSFESVAKPYVPEGTLSKVEYIETDSGVVLTNFVNEFGKTHNVFATQTHVFGSYDSNANPINKFCAFVWWR